MTSRLSLAVGVGCAILLVAVTLRIGNRDPAVSAALVTLTAFILLVSYRLSRTRRTPESDEFRKEMAEIRQRLATLEGKVDGVLAVLSPGRGSRLPPRGTYE